MNTNGIAFKSFFYLFHSYYYTSIFPLNVIFIIKRSKLVYTKYDEVQILNILFITRQVTNNIFLSQKTVYKAYFINACRYTSIPIINLKNGARARFKS